MVRPRAQLTVVSVAGEVVTLAIVSVHSLVSVVTGVTFALATNTIASVITQGGGCVVWPTPGLKVATEGKVLR